MESGKRRELTHDLSAAKFHQAADGSLTITDVPLLASGTWTDSNIGSPLFYPEDILKQYAENWYDNPLWCRHSGGVPRSITDKIGEIVKPRYHDKAVHGDLILHGKTQASRDAIEMVAAGLASAVSVEHSGKERWDPEQRTSIAEELSFYGAALVNKGACDVCTINNEASRSSAEANDMDIKELETKLSEAESKIKELSEASETTNKQLSELESELAYEEEGEDEDDALLDRLDAIEDKLDALSELEARLVKIEKTPLPGATLAGDDGKELGEINLNPIHTDSEGMTRRMF